MTDSMKDALREVGRSSDARGEFSFLVVPGEYEVVAKRQEPGESAVMGTAPGRVELKLPFTLKIEGSVVDPAGKPIAGANVRASRTDVPNYTYGAVSDAQGKFEVPVRGPGTFEVSVSRAVGGPEKKLIVELGSAGAKPVKVVLEAVAVLRGSVVDSAGKPIAKVLVEAVPTSLPQLMMLRMQGRANVDLAQVVPMAKMMNMVFTATTAADGSFELPWAQEALVFVELKGFGADPVTAVPTAAMKIVLQARSVARGRVLDFAGKPVGRFTLNAQQVSDPDGRFEVSLPGSGALPLRIDAKPAPIESRSVEVPSSVGVVELGDLKLRQGFAVGGRVFAAETGKPIKHPFIRATSKAGDVDGIAVQQDGTFTYQGVPEGLLDIVVSAEGYSATTVSARAGDREVAIKLHRFASLTVTVLRDGEPASGASVKALGPPKPEGKNERYASVGPEGNAKLDQLEAGEWTVQVVDGPSKKVKLAPDQKGTVDFALR